MGMMQGKLRELAPKISKNTILRDRVNDEQVKLAKRGPLMVRNPKKQAKTGNPGTSILGG